MNRTTPTVSQLSLAVQLSLQSQSSGAYVIYPHSTLNEYFQVGNINPPTQGFPELKYFAIGNGGHRFMAGNANISYPIVNQHDPRHASLFSYMPFIARPIGSDLTDSERLSYRMRKKETYNNVEYWMYYLKVLPYNLTTTNARVVTVQNKVITSDVEYVPTVDTLMNPIPVTINNVGVNAISGTYLSLWSPAVITLNELDISEILNACAIKFGDANLAYLSETAMVSGYDQQLLVEGTTYTEVRTAQILTFGYTSSYLPNATSIPIKFNIGDSLPLS